MSDRFIHFNKVTKDYGRVRVVEDLDLAIRQGEFVSLLGPSGSGKTTLLMMLAGFEDVSGGQILLDGQCMNDVPTYRRDMGVVFQNYALFPHMTIARNVAFPLEMRGTPKSDIDTRVRRALDMVQLAHLSDRLPGQLSGGQQQRVALARALVFEPRVVLMDEPLGALDKQLREQMQLDIRDLHHRLGLTIIFVTHDQDEALTMSDRIAVFNHGQIQQCDTPRAIYDHPANRFVAEFIGEANLLEASYLRAEGTDSHIVRLGNGTELTSHGPQGLGADTPVLVSLRPERIDLYAPGSQPGGQNGIKATVRDTVYQGDHLRVVLDSEAGPITACLNRKVAEWPLDSQVIASFGASDGWLVLP